MGIEPTRPAWEAGVLPLNYTCMARIKPGLSDMVYFILFCLHCQGVALFLFRKDGERGGVLRIFREGRAAGAQLPVER